MPLAELWRNLQGMGVGTNGSCKECLFVVRESRGTTKQFFAVHSQKSGLDNNFLRVSVSEHAAVSVKAGLLASGFLHFPFLSDQCEK